MVTEQMSKMRRRDPQPVFRTVSEPVDKELPSPPTPNAHALLHERSDEPGRSFLDLTCRGRSLEPPPWSLRPENYAHSPSMEETHSKMRGVVPRRIEACSPSFGLFSLPIRLRVVSRGQAVHHGENNYVPAGRRKTGDSPPQCVTIFGRPRVLNHERPPDPLLKV